jgi:DNA segregation ATPase FtsK/SpoIIIE, S-DNA-T family
MTLAVQDDDEFDDEGRELVIRPEEPTREPVPTREPIYAEITSIRDHEPRDIVPAVFKDRDGRRTLVKHVGGRVVHATAFHGFRVPVYLPRIIGYVGRGAHRAGYGFTGWAFDREHKAVRAEAVRTLNLPEARAQYRQRQHRVKFRAGVFWTVTILLAVAILTAWLALSRLQLAGVALVLIVGLAYVGRPKDRPAFAPAVIKTQYRRLTADMVEVALLAAGLAKLDKEGRHRMRWVQPVTRDGAGYLAVIDLPPGTTFKQAMDERASIASGLHCAVEQVWPERDRVSERRLRLWVGDQAMADMTPPTWPLLKAGQVDMFGEWPFALTARGRVAAMCLIFANLLVGAVPRMGKTFAMRLAALAAALDPTCELHIFDLKGGADWVMFETVAHVVGIGDQPEELDLLVNDLRGIKLEMGRRYAVLNRLGRAKDPRVPEGKVTRALADDRTLRMHPIVVSIDEIQFAFAKSCEHRDEIEELLEDLIKRGPAAGIIVLVGTQKPDDKSLPSGIANNMSVRFGMRVLTYRASDMILGDGMSSAGYRAQAFTRADVGVGYLVGASMTADAEVVKTFYIDSRQAEIVIARARVLRESRGTLSGHAVGVAPVKRSSLLDDVAAVMEGDRMHCATLADLMSTAFPEQYAGWDSDRLGGALRGQGVEVKQTKIGRTNRQGVYRSEIQRVQAARESG